MATNHTENYNLNLWEPGDSFLRTEFNENTRKLDAAIKAVDAKADTKASAAALNALTQTVAKKGNCRIVRGTYTGDGEYGPNHRTSLTFDGKPIFIVILINQGILFLARDVMHSSTFYYGDRFVINAFWEGNTVSWYCGESSFAQGSYGTQTYIAFLEA